MFKPVKKIVGYKPEDGLNILKALTPKVECMITFPTTTSYMFSYKGENISYSQHLSRVGQKYASMFKMRLTENSHYVSWQGGQRYTNIGFTLASK